MEDYTILIVDDMIVNIQYLTRILTKNGYKTEYSINGDGAIELANKKKFDLILLDVVMPDMDGYSVCSKLKQSSNSKDIPIFFITAKNDIDSITKGFEVGGIDYITKPFNDKELLIRIQTHLDLKRHKDKLEELVQQRTEELVCANKELEVLDMAKTDFLNLLSHEIRTPLNGIKLPLQILKNRNKGDKQLQKMVEILDNSVKRLEEFSYSALLITKLKSKNIKLKKVTCSIWDLINFELTNHDAVIANKHVKINLNFSNKITIQTDIKLFNEAVSRILDNAFKYIPDNGEITISSKCDNSDFYLEISDTGPGFPTNYLKSKLVLFKPGEEHVDKNMGVNLYLVKLIIEYLGGSFEIGNNEMGGAFVKIYLDLSKNI